jgi:glutamyl-tRNA reductase
MALLALGINHKTASVDIRERVTFSNDRIHEALRDACTVTNVQEVAILSTCNRTELYCSTELKGSRALLEWLGGYHGLSVSDLEGCTYAFWGEDAARHMMRVASGLDSLILGEPQILGQMKTAYVKAKEANTIGGLLGRLFQQTFAVAKRVRTDTAIGENPVSVACASVNLAKRIFSDMSENTALLIGAGETIELVSKYLKEAGVKKIIVANRTLSRARTLADQLGGTAITLEDIPSRLAEADIVIASTASPLPVLGKGAVERALKLRRRKPMFMVDIAVPRDIEPQVGDLDDVYLYTVDDLKQVVEENIKSRQGAAEEASHLIDSGAADFMYQLRARGAVNTLKQFRGYAEGIRVGEMEKAMNALKAGADPEKILAMMSRGITNKLIHTPTVQARKLVAEGRPEVNDWIRELYDLPDHASQEYSVENEESQT